MLKILWNGIFCLTGIVLGTIKAAFRRKVQNLRLKCLPLRQSLQWVDLDEKRLVESRRSDVEASDGQNTHNRRNSKNLDQFSTNSLL